jgi:hypothetical protein
MPVQDYPAQEVTEDDRESGTCRDGYASKQREGDHA